MSNDDTAESTKTLSTVGFEIVQLFSTLSGATIRDHQGVEQGDIVGQQQRFDLWATNIGLHQRGHASLDYRFRDAPDFQDYCRTLLEDLVKALEIVISELLDVSKNRYEAHTIGGSGEVDVISDDEDSLNSYDDETTAVAAFASAVDCIDRLFRLSMKVRNPATRTGLSKGYAFRRIDEDTGLDLFDCFADRNIDEEHIKNILQVYKKGQSLTAGSGSCLVSRLAKANNQRRRQFAYWSQHKLNLVRRSGKLKSTQQQQQVQVQVQVEIPAMLRGPSIHHSKPTTATQLDFAKIDLDDETRSAVSTMSMDISELTDTSRELIPFPNPPEKYTSQEGLKEFECPYCYTVCSRRLLSRRQWRAHILKDLRPYVCTYEECKSGSQLYDSFDDWLNHEFGHHNMTSGSGACSISDPDLPQYRECPFCSKVSPTLRTAAQHIATHLIRVALFALPRSTGIEVDQDDRSTVSNQNAARSGSVSSDDARGTVSGSLSLDDEPLVPDTEEEMMPRGIFTEGEKGLSVDHPDRGRRQGEMTLELDMAEELEMAEGPEMTLELEMTEELEMEELETSKIVLGLEHPDTLMSMANLAVIYQKQERWKEAEKLQTTVTERSIKVLGQDHPDTLVSMASLAVTYQKQGRLKEAEKLQIQVVEMSEKILGRDHPDTLSNMNIMTIIYENQGQLKEAEELQTQVIEMRKTVLGPDHPHTLKSMADLALIYQNQGRLKEAEQLQIEMMEPEMTLG